MDAQVRDPNRLRSQSETMASSSKKRAKLTYAGTKPNDGGSHFTRTAEWNGLFPLPKEHRKRKTARDKVFFFLFLSVLSIIVVVYSEDSDRNVLYRTIEHHLKKTCIVEKEKKFWWQKQAKFNHPIITPTRQIRFGTCMMMSIKERPGITI